jgi:hypothetical protein
MAPFPHPAHRTGQADFPHPALGQGFTLSRATPSAAFERLLELIGFPISRSFTTYYVCLELRSLPSTGVTRLQRYYEPLRHPKAPSLSLTGALSRQIRLLEDHIGVPLFVRLPRGLAFTEAGDILRNHCQHAFRELQEGIGTISGVRPRQSLVVAIARSYPCFRNRGLPHSPRGNTDRPFAPQRYSPEAPTSDGSCGESNLYRLRCRRIDVAP